MGSQVSDHRREPFGGLRTFGWRRAWEPLGPELVAEGQVIPFFAYPAEVRKIIYTTNAIESLNMQLRKIIKTRSHFPSDEAATKLLYLALRNITAKWKAPPTGWI